MTASWSPTAREKDALQRHSHVQDLPRVDAVWPWLADRHGSIAAVDAPHAAHPEHFNFGELAERIATAAAVLATARWLKRTGIVYYPFLDPTLPAPRAIAFHFALLAVIAAFFGLGAGVDKVASLLPFVVRAPLLYAGACSLMWTNFIRGRPGELAAQAEGGTE